MNEFFQIMENVIVTLELLKNSILLSMFSNLISTLGSKRKNFHRRKNFDSKIKININIEYMKYRNNLITTSHLKL